jgi:hypothetical protein
MKALSHFGDKLGKHPLMAVLGLIIDYFIYIGIVFFFILLLIMKWPMRFIDKITGLKSREGFIDIIGKIAGA